MSFEKTLCSYKISYGWMQADLTTTIEIKCKLEERLAHIAEESEYLKKKANDYSNELRCLLMRVK